MSNSYCAAPFRSMYLNGGTLRPCCWYDKKLLTNKNKTLADVNEVFHSQELSDIRNQIEKGEKLAGCARCHIHEDLGGKSHRMFWNQRSFSDSSELASTPVLKALDLYMGNLCNLKCVSCSSYNSSPWAADEKVLNGKADFPQLERFALDKVDWAALKDIEWIKFAGGEVLLMKEHRGFLTELIRRGWAAKIELNYVTNNTVAPDEFKALWQEFKSVRLILSLDGIGEVSDYVRFPSRWPEIETNILKFLALPFAKVEVNSVVSLLNVYHISEVDDWWAKNSGGCPIFFRVLDRPENLKLQRIPTVKRPALIAKLSGYENLKHIVEVLNGPEETGIEESFAWLRRLDQIRQRDFFKINSWLRSP